MTTPPPARPWKLIILGSVLAWVLYLAFFGPKIPTGGDLSAPRLDSPNAIREANFAWKLQDLGGETVELSKFRGKTIFLNIWATWCPPCVAEMPSIANLAGNSRLKDVAFVCVSTDDSAEPVRTFLRDKHWPMTILRATDMPDVFATEGIPATFIIAPDGRVVSSDVGSAEWDNPSVVDFLEKLTKLQTKAEPSPKTAG
ncbi:TlpA family protein disulfide reductase [Singulisphaera sp. PoT]|uniref:TlpA family protein disulfide reductase n=1 Tax=Singulisphaera sp. PoT TaxID=3411797 RepID=UPI003BF52643